MSPALSNLLPLSHSTHYQNGTRLATVLTRLGACSPTFLGMASSLIPDPKYYQHHPHRRHW